MKYKLIGIDLDGTLLTKFKKITKKNLVAISDYLSAGGIPVIATGRSIVSAKKFCEKIEKFSNAKMRFLICFNGALIYDTITKNIEADMISDKICKEIYQYAKKNKMSAWFYTENAMNKKAVEVKGCRFSILTKLTKNLNLLRANPTKNLSSFKINLMSYKKNKVKKALLELQQKYKNILSFSLSSKNLIEINNYEIDKGSSLTKIMKKCDINSENVAFIGDSLNDAPGFKISNISFSIKPKNIEVSKLATNNINFKKNAVAHVINNFFLNDKKTKIKFVVTDLDGTLLDNETKEVVDEAKNAITKIVDDQNLYFAIASGRNIDDVKLIMHDIGIKNTSKCYAIVNNGSLIYEFISNTYIYTEIISNSLTEQIFNIILNLSKNKKFGEIGCYIHRIINISELEKQESAELLGFNLKFVQDKLIKMSKNFTKKSWSPKTFIEMNKNSELNMVCKFVIYTDKPENNQLVYDYFNSMKLDVEVTTSSPTNIEINAKNVSKGNALLFLAQKLGININETMPIGDEENDVSMLSISSNSVSIHTSKEIVKNAAAFVLKSKPSYLVADAINKKILEKGNE